MKFVCDRCGKKYATAGDPAPGKLYRLKCRACGHLIAVRGQAGTETGIPVVAAASATLSLEPALTPPPAGWPEPISEDAIVPLQPVPPGEPLPLPPEVAMAVDSAAGAQGPEFQGPPTRAGEAPGATPQLLDPALTPPSPDKDELADFAAAAAEAMEGPIGGAAGQAGGAGFLDPGGGARSPVEDTFAAAARASLPDSWSGATPIAAPPPPPAPRPARPAPPRARPPKSGLGPVPLAIIGLGLLALVGIAAYALRGTGGTPAPAPSVAVVPVAAPAPEPPRPPEAETRLAAPGPAAGSAPAPREEERSPEPRPEPRARAPERRPERAPEPRVAERKPAPPPEPPPAPEVMEPRSEPRQPDLPDASAALTPEVVDRVVGANRRAFSACIASASTSGVKLDGRRVALRITINTNGTVTYPTLDDQALNTTEMGQCLKSAARLMIFPRFQGDPYHHEVPLVLGGG